MAVTIEDLYRSYGVLADAKDNLSQVHTDTHLLCLLPGFNLLSKTAYISPSSAYLGS